MKSAISPLFQLGICTVGYLYATSNPTFAQVTSDGTVNTQVDQNGNVAEITQGETRGSNLFHSFQDFSVTTGNEAFFNNANDISNIFSRVTGGNISNIDGLIRANGSASLFLINPAGIVFGEGARLDIGGSFYGSTASSILFEDGEFSAADLDSSPLLTINAPIGLGFRDNPGDIENNSVAGEGNGLEISPNQTIALVGGNISFDGGIISAPDGNVSLGGLIAAGEIGVNDDGGLVFSDSVAKGNVSLANSSQIFVAGENGGSIFVNARNLDSTTSGMNAGIASGAGMADTQAGDIQIDATEAIALTSSSIFNQVQPESIGKGGDIKITAKSFSAIDGSRIVAFTSGRGDSGNISINASEIISLSESTLLSTRVLDEAEGNAGEIEISARSFSILNLSQLNSLSLGQGNTGNINITTSDTASIDGAAERTSAILSLVGVGATGNVGDINIQAKSLSITNGGQLVAANDGTGNAGGINLNISDTVSFDGVGGEDSTGLAFPSAVFSDVGVTGIGNGGNITIQTNNFSATNGGQLVASTFGQGNAGDINIEAQEEVSFEGVGDNQLSSAAFTRVDFDGVGNGGDINITAKQLSVTEGAELIANTRGQGNAGDVNIIANETVILDGVEIVLTGEEVLQERTVSGGIFTDVQDAAIGDGGDITISTGAIVVRNGAEINASTFGSGNSGNIEVNADSIALENGSSIVATNRSQNGGNISLQIAEDLILQNNGSISARAFNDANGGNLSISSRFIIAFPDGNNDIIASAQQGNGGNISISAESLFGIEERPLNGSTNDINASSEFSLDGSITITTLNIDPLQGATELPNNVVEPEQSTQQACRANRNSTARSGLNITGKGGIVADPGLPLDSLNVTVNGENDLAAAIPAPIETSKGKIQPARGIKISESGAITLTAYRTDGTGDRLIANSINCDRT